MKGSKIKTERDENLGIGIRIDFFRDVNKWELTTEMRTDGNKQKTNENKKKRRTDNTSSIQSEIRFVTAPNDQNDFKKMADTWHDSFLVTNI